MDQYWASVGTDEIGKEMMSRVKRYKKYLKTSGKLDELRKSYETYYGNINIEDVDESIKAIEINHYANLIRHIHVMVTSTRPAWEPRSANTDTESQASTQLASGLLDFYMREKKLADILSEATEKGLFLDEGWVSVGWNVTSGEIYGQNPDNGQPIQEGDVEYKVHTLVDVTRDRRKKNMSHAWFIVEEQENKWDLIAKYPELSEKLRALTYSKEDALEYGLNPVELFEDEEDDLIPVYILRHDKTPAMPSGRLTVIAAEDVVLFDGPLPYRGTYIYPITSAKHFETAFGHSQAKDLLPIQDAFNATVSAIVTNQSANAVQNFQAPKGSAPRVTQLSGMNIWEYDPKAGKIETMDLLNTAPEVFKFADFLVSQSELISGVNQIARGNAPATLSGAAMALIQQQAIQFSSGIQQSYISLSEAIGTATIELLQTFAVVPRIAMIAGKSKRTMMKKFTGRDLNGISRVIVDSANPLTKTAAGRVEIANMLMQSGHIKRPEQYLTVLSTGNLEPLYENEVAENYLMRSENEWLMEGKQVRALMTDNHAMHVLEHASILNSPEARMNPEGPVVANALAHIQEHIGFAKTMDPVLSAMLKQASFAMQAPPQAPNAGPQGGGEPQMGNVMDNQNPITQQAEQVQLPDPSQPPQV